MLVLVGAGIMIFGTLDTGIDSVTEMHPKVLERVRNMASRGKNSLMLGAVGNLSSSQLFTPRHLASRATSLSLLLCVSPPLSVFLTQSVKLDVELKVTFGITTLRSIERSCCSSTISLSVCSEMPLQWAFSVFLRHRYVQPRGRMLTEAAFFM